MTTDTITHTRSDQLARTVRPGTTPPVFRGIRSQLHDLALTVEQHGVAGIDRRHLDALLLAGVDVGASSVLLDVLADDGAPPPARTRAFGRIAVAIAGAPAGAPTVEAA